MAATVQAFLRKVQFGLMARSDNLLRQAGPLYGVVTRSRLFVKHLPERLAYSGTKEQSQKLQQQMRSDGFIMIRDFMPKSEVARVMAEIKKREAAGNYVVQGSFWHFYRSLHEMFTPDQLETMREKVQPMIESYLGMRLHEKPDVSFYKTNIDHVEGSSFLWHHDATFYNVNAIIYLTDVNSDDEGPFQAIPNSFKSVHENYTCDGSRVNVPKDTKWNSAIGKAGDAVIFDTGSVHRAGLVKTGEGRYVLSLHFAPYQLNVYPDSPELRKIRWKHS